MSSTTPANLYPTGPQKRLLTPRGWLWLIVLGVLFGVLFRNVFLRTLLIIADDPPCYRPTDLWSALSNLLHGRFNQDWSHGLVLPFISVYFIHQNRARLMQARPRLCWLGLLLLFQGTISFAWWIWPGRNDMFQGYSVILTLVGLVLFLVGPEVMKMLWFPVLYLTLAVPVSDEAWNALSLRLKMFASHASTVALNVLGVPFHLDATVDGAVITLFRNGKYLGGLNVEDACSGLRMLMAFIALGAAVAFLSHRPTWQRWVLVILTVPVAMAVNVGRVTVTGFLHLVSPEMAKGDFHTFVGMFMLLPALGLFLLVGWILDKTFIYDEVDDRDGKSPAIAPRVQAVLEPRPPRPAAAALLVAATVVLNFFLLLGLFQTVRYASYLFAFLGDKYRLPAYVACWGLILILSWLLAWRLDALICRLLGGQATASDADAASRPPLKLGPLTGRGFLMGAGITALVGINYALLLASFRPEDFLHGLFRFWLVIALLAIALLALTGAGWAILRLFYAGSARRALSTLVGRGLTAGVLLTATLGLTAVLSANRVVVFKESINLRQELWDGVPKKVAGWEMVQETKLDGETLKSLGTTHYITRNYHRVAPTPGEAAKLVTLHVTYYTGTVDTVPHVPWRCWSANGMMPGNPVDTTLELQGAQYAPARGGGAWAVLDGPPNPSQRVYLPAQRFTATIFSFDPQAPSTRSNVVYFFVANGKYLKSPDMVRLQGFDPGDRYGYYAKIEVVLHNLGDQELARTQASAFLSAMMPHIMACLPDWEALKQGSPLPKTAVETPETRVLSR
jgi:exosortase